jgi:endonuclease/exonuclease/phosphatase (EEP) superfamily protein YafD
MPSWPTIVSWALAVTCAFAALVRVFGLDRGAFLVQLVAFTPYVALGSIVAAIVAGLTRRWWALVVAGISAAFLVGCVVPRAVSSDWAAAASATPITIMSANLRLGGADVQSIVDLVREAQVDVLALQEYTHEVELALIDAGLVELLPYRESRPDRGPRGSAIYSRLPLTDGGSRVASTDGYYQAYATVKLPGGSSVVIESVHPVPPIDADQTQSWEAGLRNQVRADAPGPARILVGDFNATLDHDQFRELLATGYRDAAAEVGAGLTPTWPYYGRRSIVTPRITVDHVLVPAGVGVRGFRAVTIPHSDHRAIVATLTV